MSADIFSATAEVMSWLIDTSSRSAISLTDDVASSAASSSECSSKFSNPLQESLRGQGLETKLLDPSEVLPVVGHDGFTPGRHGHLKNHVIPDIPQKGSPEEEYLLKLGHAADVVEDVADIAPSEVGFLKIAKQGIFVLQDQRNRQGNLELARSDQGQDPEGRTAAGTDGCDGDIRIKNHPGPHHDGIVYDTIDDSQGPVMRTGCWRLRTA